MISNSRGIWVNRKGSSLGHNSTERHKDQTCWDCHPRIEPWPSEEYQALTFPAGYG